ncbi:hypothetical protein D8B23_20250 [Verminephrobacter aporrectodeae subsp. tuberculatae]|uniref:Uncharacterized protein n=1 Tax=Verminephrobacter aporrectodeae subsp. tuberculatae TaxID=1110392 RepID=A0ABT3KSE3_9BURK|nr:hypothetical protein [Verminephrobacter aporrectodeae subsp. tuberculatae]MCW5256187.1 hypothetical protein [Verminephrobacter aporrectodeae subsp. tuberculatae]MCW5289101.1 hypothetical protein [Verminephrobacter aporrectodeae subsp. tuberculatae]MCW5321239.1 hypothetical protein [Verminephrobacter aporrectodeae subsp. tuberculatae]MCW8177511.1 hypothetical protein [Verminephrobacter aporrectodeae subsp. tuberculatae]
MSGNRLPDYLDHIQQAAANARSFVEGLAKDDFLADNPRPAHGVGPRAPDPQEDRRGPACAAPDPAQCQGFHPGVAITPVRLSENHARLSNSPMDGRASYRFHP